MSPGSDLAHNRVQFDPLRCLEIKGLGKKKKETQLDVACVSLCGDVIARSDGTASAVTLLSGGCAGTDREQLRELQRPRVGASQRSKQNFGLFNCNTEDLILFIHLFIFLPIVCSAEVA